MLLDTKPTQKQAKAGLRQRPTYDQMIGVIVKDEKVKLPDRRFKFLTDTPEYNALSHESNMEAMEDQQMKVVHEQQKDALMTEKAIKSKDMGKKEVKVQDTQTAARPEYFDMAVQDDFPTEMHEQQIQEEVHGRKEQKRNKLNVVKDIVRTRVRHVKTMVERVMNPTSNADSQTTPVTATPIETQTEPVQSSEPNPISINKKIKSKIKEEKVKRERKKKDIKDEAKDNLNDETMKASLEEPKPEIAAEVMPKKRRSRSRTKKNKSTNAEEEPKTKEETKPEIATEVVPEKRSRTRSRTKETKAIEAKENKKRSQSEPAAESAEKRVRAVPNVKSEPEPKAKAKAKAKPRASSGSVEVAHVKLPTSTDPKCWGAQSANEIRSQLFLMGVPKAIQGFKKKTQLIEMLIQAIKTKK